MRYTYTSRTTRRYIFQEDIHGILIFGGLSRNPNCRISHISLKNFLSAISPWAYFQTNHFSFLNKIIIVVLNIYIWFPKHFNTLFEILVSICYYLRVLREMNNKQQHKPFVPKLLYESDILNLNWDKIINVCSVKCRI